MANHSACETGKWKYQQVISIIGSLLSVNIFFFLQSNLKLSASSFTHHPCVSKACAALHAHVRTLAHVLQRLWLYPNGFQVLTPTYNFDAETHPGPQALSSLVFPSVALSQVLTSTVVGSTAPRKAQWRFWLHCSECHHRRTSCPTRHVVLGSNVHLPT